MIASMNAFVYQTNSIQDLNIFITERKSKKERAGNPINCDTFYTLLSRKFLLYFSDSILCRHLRCRSMLLPLPPFHSTDIWCIAYLVVALLIVVVLMAMLEKMGRRWKLPSSCRQGWLAMQPYTRSANVDPRNV